MSAVIALLCWVADVRVCLMRSTTNIVLHNLNCNVSLTLCHSAFDNTFFISPFSPLLKRLFVILTVFLHISKVFTSGALFSPNLICMNPLLMDQLSQSVINMLLFFVHFVFFFSFYFLFNFIYRFLFL